MGGQQSPVGLGSAAITFFTPCVDTNVTIQSRVQFECKVCAREERGKGSGKYLLKEEVEKWSTDISAALLMRGKKT
jgi:hypothetical protein